jgi:hypothetical protein
MKQSSLSVIAVFLLVQILSGPVFAWQGRMAGLGDARGLIEDESDYLTHPASIAAGSGLVFYGNYRLDFDKGTRWDHTMSSPAFSVAYPYSASGRTWKNEGQLGAVFPLGPGRMGVFFEYTGAWGKHGGEESYAGFWSDADYYTYDLKNNLDDYALRLIYGLPVENVRLGGEIRLARRYEEQESSLLAPWGIETNYPWAAEGWPEENLYPFLIPHRSKYWEAQGKVSVEGRTGPVKYDFTLRGGIPMASDNRYVYAFDFADVTEMEGRVKGFNAGGDLWLRIPLRDNLILPFVVSAEYRTIKRDGAGLDGGTIPVAYDHETKSLVIKAGGGIDVTPAKGTRVAAGIYYDYIASKESTYHAYSDSSEGIFTIDTYSHMPKRTEHRLTLKALVEKELTPTFVLRGGVNAFYGWARSDYVLTASWNESSFDPLDASPRGSNTGVNVSVGATVRCNQVSLEPFINGGFAHDSISGDGTYGSYPVQMDLKKTNWVMGGGISARF